MVQALEPDADVANPGAWSDSQGNDDSILWNDLDGDEAGYLRTQSSPTNKDFRVGFQNGVDPAVDSGHEVRTRLFKSASGGKQINFVVEVYDSSGPGLISTFTHNNVDEVPTLFTDVLPDLEAANIADYTAIEVRVIGNEAGGPAGNRRAQIDFARFHVPDAGGGGSMPAVNAALL